MGRVLQASYARRGVGAGALVVSALVIAGYLGPMQTAGAANVPSAPRSLAALSGPGAGQVSLSWLAPTSSGASPVLQYGLAVSTDGGSTWSTPPTSLGSAALNTATSCANSGAANANGKGCRYRVVAMNASGTGAPSNVATTWVVPSAPRSFVGTFTDATFGSANLSWLAPTTNGGFPSVDYAVQSNTDGAGFTTVATTQALTATVPCTGALSCAYRVAASDLQGSGPSTSTSTLTTAPGRAQSLTALTQSSDAGTGVSQVLLSFYLPTTGMPADHLELGRCTIAMGATSGCGTSANPNIGAWSTSQTLSGPFGAPVTVSDTCTAGVATCYWRVRAVNARGGVGAWRSVNLQPWAPGVSTLPGPAAGQVTVLFSGPAESGPSGSAKYYTALVCSANCSDQGNWADSGLTIPYPPAGTSPHTAGVVSCGTNATCQVRMQFTDGHGARGVMSAAATGRGANLTIASPADQSFTNDTTPTISGTCTIGAGDILATVVPGPVNLSAACSAGGTWSGDLATALAEGPYGVTATQTGALGVSNTVSFTVDTTPPAVTLVDPGSGAVLSTSSVSFSGTCSEVGADVTVTVTGTPSATLAASCTSPGGFSVSQGLPNGAYSAKASQTDVAGNTGSSTDHAFTVTAPLPVVTIDSPADGGYSNTPSTTISGVCTTSDGNVALTVTGPSGSASTAACVAGQWTATKALADGAYSAVATQTDGVGNVGSSGTKTFVVDTIAPVITASARKADTTSYTAGSWSNQTVTVHYTCSDTGSGVASCPADQVFASDGTTASTSGTATDNAGNSASASFGPIKVDKTAPSAAVTFPVNGKRYNTTRWNAGCSPVGACGTASDGGSGLASVTVRVERTDTHTWWNGSAFVAGAIDAPTTGTTSWKTALPASALTNGAPYTVTVTATDLAGNVKTASSSFTYDTSGPVVSTAAVTNKSGVVQSTGVDTLSVTFTEAIDPATVPATATLTIQRDFFNPTTYYGISGLTNGLQSTGASFAYRPIFNWGSMSYDGTLTLSNGNKTIAFTVTAGCVGSCQNLATSPVSGAWQFAPATTLLDDAGNTATGSFTASPATAMF